MSGIILLNLKKDADYASLRDWCLTVYDFYLSLYPGQTTQLVVNLYKQSIDKIDKKKDITKMKALYDETNMMFREDIFGAEAMEQLNKVLKDKFNHCISDEIEEENMKIDRIIKSGRITNDKEYELVKQYEEGIYADESQVEKAEMLRSLMVKYENR